MIDYAALRTSVVSRLKSALGIPVIMGDQTGALPPYPFVTYKLTSPYLETSQHGAEGVEDIPGGIKRTRQKHVEVVFSFTAHSDNADTAYQRGYEIVEHFDFAGRDSLREAGVVVAGMSNVQSRDVFLTVEYERRVGLDIRLRVIDRSEITDSPGGFIETAEITNQGG